MLVAAMRRHEFPIAAYREAYRPRFAKGVEGEAR